MLQNDNVAAALVGASRPEQVTENVKAAGVTIPAELMKPIDEVLGDVPVTDPGDDGEVGPGGPRLLTRRTAPSAGGNCARNRVPRCRTRRADGSAQWS